MFRSSISLLFFIFVRKPWIDSSISFGDIAMASFVFVFVLFVSFVVDLPCASY